MDSGSGGAEPEVLHFSGACHKHFRTLAQAEAFMADWKEMSNCVAKAKKELLNGCRPTKMKVTRVGLSLNTEGGGADSDELTDGLSRMRI